MSEPFATRAHVHTGFPPKLAAKGTGRLPGGAHGSRSQAEASFLCLTWGLPQRERPSSLSPECPSLQSSGQEFPPFPLLHPCPVQGPPPRSPRPHSRRVGGQWGGKKERAKVEGSGGRQTCPCPHPTPFLWGRSLGTPWFLPPRGFEGVGSGCEIPPLRCRKSRSHGCMG